MGRMRDGDRTEWIALAWHGQLGPAAFHKLVERCGSPRAVCEAGADELRACRARLTEEQIERIGQAMEAATDVAEEVELLEEEGVRVVCAFEEGYPTVLAALRTKPPVLSVRGTLDESRDVPAVAIVGTRSPTAEGMDLAHELARGAAQEQVTVVSGLARGIDSAAHQGALEGGGRTLAILGSGIRVVHPTENRELADAIAKQGALVSELSPRARPSVRTLMARNRLQSALSNAVVVVESGAQGGALQTAADARRQGRRVYAVAWDVRRDENAGNRELLAGDAAPLRGPDDLPAVLSEVREHDARAWGSAEDTDRPAQLPLF